LPTDLKYKLVRFTAKKAAGFPADDIELERTVGSSEYLYMRRAVGLVSSRIIDDRDGHIYCGICGRGPFTKRGFYLHLIRMHGEEIYDMIIKEYEAAKRFYRGLYTNI
jgi:hypothetical protein